MIDESLSISTRDLEILHVDDEVRNRLLYNELADFYLHLSRLQESPSQRYKDHRRDRSRVRKKPVLSSSTANVISQSIDFQIPSTPPSFSQFNLPSSIPNSDSSSVPVTPQNKRIPSDSSTTSYAISSTETTPQKLDKPEQEVQSLQNIMIMTLLRAIWRGAIPVPWAMNRKMWIDYVTLVPLLYQWR